MKIGATYKINFPNKYYVMEDSSMCLEKHAPNSNGIYEIVEDPYVVGNAADIRLKVVKIAEALDKYDNLYQGYLFQISNVKLHHIYCENVMTVDHDDFYVEDIPGPNEPEKHRGEVWNPIDNCWKWF